MNRTPIARQSARQYSRERELSAYKRKLILRALDEDGFVHCPCGASFGPETAFNSLDLHHIQQRSMGGQDEPVNLQLLCFRCHRTEVHA